MRALANLIRNDWGIILFDFGVDIFDIIVDQLGHIQTLVLEQELDIYPKGLFQPN